VAEAALYVMQCQSSTSREGLFFFAGKNRPSVTGRLVLFWWEGGGIVDSGPEGGLVIPICDKSSDFLCRYLTTGAKHWEERL